MQQQQQRMLWDPRLGEQKVAGRFVALAQLKPLKILDWLIYVK
jgi:hypothetical protein